jgi:hypothetical protein
MGYSYTLFSMLVIGNCVSGMQSNELAESIKNQFIEAAQSGWNPTTKAILRDPNSSTQTKAVFTRYIDLFIEHAKQRYQQGASVEQAIMEVRNTYPTCHELAQIYGKKMAWGAWLTSFVRSNPVCAQEWKQRLWMYENTLANEQYQSHDPIFFGCTQNSSESTQEIPQ